MMVLSLLSIFLVEALYQNIATKPLRSKGFALVLSDAEIITMELVGKSLGFDADKGIRAYFKNCYQYYFPKLGSYLNFAKHCANLVWVKDKMMTVLGSLYINQNHQSNLPYLIDSFPLSVYIYQRTRRHKSFRGWLSLVIAPAKTNTTLGLRLIY